MSQTFSYISHLIVATVLWPRYCILQIRKLWFRMFKSPAQKYIARRITKCLILILIWQLQCQVLDHYAICLPTLSYTKVSVTVVHVLAVFSGCLTVCCCCSVTKSYWTLQPHGLQHSRLPCPSLFPRVCSDSCQLSPWCHPTISSSVARFSSYPQYFSASGSFPVSWLFPSDGQSIRASASASILPMNIQGWFLLELTGLISLQSKGFSRSSAALQFESINSLVLSLHGPTLTSVHDY